MRVERRAAAAAPSPTEPLVRLFTFINIHAARSTADRTQPRSQWGRCHGNMAEIQMWRTAVPPALARLSPGPCRAACTRLADSDTLVSRPRDGPRRAPPPPSRRCLRIRLEIPMASPCTVRLAKSRRTQPCSTTRLLSRLSFADPPPAAQTCVCERERELDTARGGRPSSLPSELEGAHHDARHFPVSSRALAMTLNACASEAPATTRQSCAISCSARAHPRLPQARQSAPTHPRGSHAIASPGCRHPRRRGCRR